MGKPKYDSSIILDGNVLKIRLEYGWSVSSEYVERSRDYFQHRFSERAGFPIPRDEVQVQPRELELAPTVSMLHIELDKPVCPILLESHGRAPYVFPMLLNDLREFADSNSGLGVQLAEYAIESLEEMRRSARPHLRLV